jgi:hypothetical protein
MDFKKIVVLIMFLFLVVIFSFLTYVLYNNKNNYVYAPEVGKCPDYFDIQNNNNKISCYNKNKQGKCMNKTHFDNNDFGNTVKEKNKWAKSCNITWDGITNISDENE